MEKTLDIIIFGATGFTGKEIVKFLYNLVKNGEKIKWGIGGRNETKLKGILNELGEEDFDSIPIFLAETENPHQLIHMTSQCRLLLNCVGPYQLYGEAVIKACLQTSTNYIDITAEPQFMEKIQLIYNDEAKKKNILIVTACGVDSVLTDIGLEYLRLKFEGGTLNSIETYHQIFLPNEMKPFTPLINYGTWSSLVYVMKNYKELRKIREKLWKNHPLFPDLKPKLNIKRLPYKKGFFQGWAAPYPSSDAPVMRRSQRYFYKKFNERPIQINTYLIVPKFWQLFLLLIFGLIILLLTKFQWGCNALLKYYKLFTFGVFDKEPNEKIKENLKYKVFLHGKGWNSVVDENYSSPTTNEIVGCVSGCDGYKGTAICALACCSTLLNAPKTINKGVHTAATAFRHTNLIEKLTNYGLNFEIIYKT